MLSVVGSTVRVLRANKTGVIALEYGLIASLLAAVIITAVGMVCQGLNTSLAAISGRL